LLRLGGAELAQVAYGREPARCPDEKGERERRQARHRPDEPRPQLVTEKAHHVKRFGPVTIDGDDGLVSLQRIEAGAAGNHLHVVPRAGEVKGKVLPMRPPPMMAIFIAAKVRLGGVPRS